MREIKISIIVPIYNGEKNLTRCITSILNQTLSDIEVIAINDGSTDNSLQILKSISDKRLKVYSQENKGQSFTRNLGLKLSKGEYIAFVDCDDYIDKEMLLEMYKEAKINNLEIVQCGYVNLFEINQDRTYIRKYSKEFLEKSSKEVMIGKDYFEYSPSVAPWDKIYKKSFLNKIDFKFQEGISAEDALLLTKTFFFVQRIKYINKNYYYYLRESENSVTKPNSLEKKIKLNKDKIFVAKELYDFSRKNNWKGNIQRIILPNLLLPLIKKEIFENKYRAQIINELKKVKFLQIAYQSLDKKIIYKLIKLIIYKIKYKEI